MGNRREFIKHTYSLAGGLSMLGLYACAGGTKQDRLAPTFDLHSHPGLFVAKGFPGYLGDKQASNTMREMKDGKLTGAFLSLVADMRIIEAGPEGLRPAGNFAPGEAWADYKRQIGILKSLIQAHPYIALATRAAQLGTSLNEERVAAYIGCEGGDYLEGDAGRLEEMYRDGVRSVQIVHYHPNELGDMQTEVSQHNGLSAAGRDVVKRMNELGMVIDVAHASYETVKGVADATAHPIILSHSMLTVESRHRLVKRTISAEHAKVVADTGGVIGMWPCGLNKSFDDFLDNTLRLIDAAGIDHVGLGTDMDGNFQPVLSSYLQLSPWKEGLKAKGLSDEEVGKVAGGNAARVLEIVIG
jgi:membrane dipeptidase